MDAMRNKSFLATMTGAIAISIAAMATPVFAHGGGHAESPAQTVHTRVHAPSVRELQSALLKLNKAEQDVQPLSQYSKAEQQKLDHRIVDTVESNGHEIREFIQITDEDRSHPRIWPRKQHAMQG